MSREIDRSKPLSKEDALYLSQRGLLTAEQEAEHGIGPVENGGSADLGENTGDVDTVVAPDAEPEMPDDYNEWSKGDLQDEAEARGLSKSGTVADLVERLQADDAEE